MNLNASLTLMVQQKASDLFITAGKAPTMKVNGTLVEMSNTKLSDEQTMQIILDIMSSRQRDEFENTKECQFSINIPVLGRFRISAFSQRNSAGMVIRHIESNIPDTDALNLPPHLKTLFMQKRGLILFVGATGTGKSTSLAALIKYRNQNSSGHIITIEDPIEFIHSRLGCIISQREVGLDCESYEVGLKNALRQAPDVILIGEVRSRETMQHAIDFAKTGHLCVTTLHASNANQAINRILNFFPNDMHKQLLMDLSLILCGIVAQQLIPCLDNQNRYPAIEILLNTPLASDLIRRGDLHKLKLLMKNSREQGMQTFDQALFDLFQMGKISAADAIASADSPNEVRLMIKYGTAQASKLDLDAVTLFEYDRFHL